MHFSKCCPLDTASSSTRIQSAFGIPITSRTHTALNAQPFFPFYSFPPPFISPFHPPTYPSNYFSFLSSSLLVLLLLILPVVLYFSHLPDPASPSSPISSSSLYTFTPSQEVGTYREVKLHSTTIE